jgi:nitrate/nitrite-specific signal transduction histidine kinase
MSDDLLAAKLDIEWLEGALKKRTRELNERVKELDFLYALAAAVEKPGFSRSELLRFVVRTLPLAWQFPRFAVARAVLGDEKHSSDNFKETPWMLREPIGKRGELNVVYLEGKPFLEEERKLLRVTAAWINSLEH